MSDTRRYSYVERGATSARALYGNDNFRTKITVRTKNVRTYTSNELLVGGTGLNRIRRDYYLARVGEISYDK